MCALNQPSYSALVGPERSIVKNGDTYLYIDLYFATT